MDSIKIKVEEFLKSHLTLKSFLQDIVNKWNDILNKEEVDYKEGKVFEEAKNYVNMMLQLSKNLFFHVLNTNFKFWKWWWRL